MAQAIKLLVVEDDAVTRRAVVRAIKRGEEQVAISEEADGRAAIALLLREPFDCALLDYQLPQTDGLTVLREVRNAGCRTPIIIMTARGDEQLAVEMMKAGASDYLSKSLLSSERLWQGLRNAMRIHKAETALRESEARLRLALGAGGLRIWDWDVVHDVFTYDQDPAQAPLGPLKLGHVIDRIHPDDQDRVRQRIDVALAEQAEFSAEFRIRRTGDVYRWTNSRGRVYRDAEGRAVRLLGVSIDIDERRQAEDALRDAEERYRALFEHSPYGVMILDPVGRRIVDFNAAAHRQLGYPPHYFATLRLDDLGAPEDDGELERQMAAAMRQGGNEFETRMKASDGEIRDVLVTFRPLDLGGKKYLHSVVLDVTERNRLRAQLLQSQKMEAIGRLAGGIAHDFNNLLAIVAGYSESLTRRLGSDHPLQTHAAEIQQAAERGGALTRQLLAFSRRTAIQPQLLDLNAIVSHVHQMLQRFISDQHSIEVLMAADLPRIWADPGQMDQVVINLAINARDAMPSGGRILFSTAPVALDADEAASRGLREGPYVMLSVSDTGLGIDPADHSRIFEPFFTTKGPAGTGLGLSIVYGIAQECGGNVMVTSEKGKGARFDVYFPAAKET